MARITHVKKAQKAQGPCEVCREPIEVGQAYKWIKPRSHPGARGTKRVRHEACRAWRPSETTSSAALSEVYGAQEAAEDDLTAWDGETLDDVTSILQTAAEGIRSGAECYRESASNIEDGFGHATSQSEELEEKADALESAADDLEASADDFEEFDVDQATTEAKELHETEDDDDPDVIQFIESAREEWADGIRDEANSLLANVDIP